MKPYMLDEEITIIDHFLDPTWNVFEWGCGGSTSRWKDKVNKWISVEHEKDWAERIGNPVLLRTNAESYLNAPYEFPNIKFDLFIVDGIYREQALAVASKLGNMALEHDSIRTKPSSYWDIHVILHRGKIESNGAIHKGIRLHLKC